MNATSQSCRMVVTTGPDRGKVFDIEQELVHIGRADENQIVLEDPSLPDHQASVLRKNGRFAIYRPHESDIQVDGAEIPTEKWVWLPTDVRLRFGRRTSCQLTYELPIDEPATSASTESAGEPVSASQSLPDVKEALRGGSSGPGSESDDAERESEAGEAEGVDAEAGTVQPADHPAETPGKRSDRKKSRRGKKSRSGRRRKDVARFITDQGGPRVELGADGHLPELALEDDPARKEKQAKPKQSSSALLYCVLALSLISSLALLLADIDPASESELSKAEAREEITRFFGGEDGELKPWQKSLRAARLAHSRGDRQAERAHYRDVLRVLNSEDRDPHIGVTGHLKSDEELRDLIAAILRE